MGRAPIYMKGEVKVPVSPVAFSSEEPTCQSGPAWGGGFRALSTQTPLRACLGASCGFLPSLELTLPSGFPFFRHQIVCNCSHHESSVYSQYLGLRGYLFFKLKLEDRGVVLTPLFLLQQTVCQRISFFL